MFKKKKSGKISPHAFDRAILSWKAPEYAHHEKSLLWFVFASGAALGLIIYGLATDGWTFSMAIAVFAGTYYLFYRHVPPRVDVKISRFAVKVGRHIFPYSHLKNFWIVYDPPFVKRVYLRMATRFQPDVFVSLENNDPAQVRETLKKYLKELEGGGEPVSDALVRLFKL